MKEQISRALISAMLVDHHNCRKHLDNSGIDIDSRAIMRGSDEYIWKAIIRCEQENKEVDLIGVIEALKEDNYSRCKMIIPYLLEIADTLVSASSIPVILEELKNIIAEENRSKAILTTK